MRATTICSAKARLRYENRRQQPMSRLLIQDPALPRQTLEAAPGDPTVKWSEPQRPPQNPPLVARSKSPTWVRRDEWMITHRRQVWQLQENQAFSGVPLPMPEWRSSILGSLARSTLEHCIHNTPVTRGDYAPATRLATRSAASFNRQLLPSNFNRRPRCMRRSSGWGGNQFV